MTTEEKKRYDRLVLVAERLMMMEDWANLTLDVGASRCDIARTIIDVARELRLGTTSRPEGK